jgi:hypothetical protein
MSHNHIIQKSLLNSMVVADFLGGGGWSLNLINWWIGRPGAGRNEPMRLEGISCRLKHAPIIAAHSIWEEGACVADIVRVGDQITKQCMSDYLLHGQWVEQ